MARLLRPLRGEVFPRYASDLCRVRDQSPSRAPAGGHRQSKGQRHLCREGPPCFDRRARVSEMKAQGLGATAIAKALGIGRASVYRVLEGGH